MDSCAEVSPEIRVNLQLAWTGDYQSLKSFVNENLKLVGEWDQPGSDKN